MGLEPRNGQALVEAKMKLDRMLPIIPNLLDRADHEMFWLQISQKGCLRWRLRTRRSCIENLKWQSPNRIGLINLSFISVLGKAIAELFAICDPRSARVGDHKVTKKITK